MMDAVGATLIFYRSWEKNDFDENSVKRNDSTWAK